jgi:hypothetical protein
MGLLIEPALNFMRLASLGVEIGIFGGIFCIAFPYWTRFCGQIS